MPEMDERSRAMKQEEIQAYLRQKPHVTSDFKLEWDAHRFCLAGKMFAMLGQDKAGKAILTLKLPPQSGAYYREAYPAWITPGYYMNKVHWSSVYYAQAKESLLEELMDQAYQCGLTSLPKKIQAELLTNT